MSNSKENLVDGRTARSLLGGLERAMSATLFSAIKKQMGISGRRRVSVGEIRKWMRVNPDFTIRQAYPRK